MSFQKSRARAPNVVCASSSREGTSAASGAEEGERPLDGEEVDGAAEGGALVADEDKVGPAEREGEAGGPHMPYALAIFLGVAASVVCRYSLPLSQRIRSKAGASAEIMVLLLSRVGFNTV